MKLLLGIAMTTSMAVAAVHAQSASPAQAVTLTPTEQLMVDAQLAVPKLDARATVTAIDLTASPLGEIVAAITKAGGVTMRYHSGVTNLDEVSAVKLPNSTVEDALRTVLKLSGLAFKATSPKAVFIYPDTPANRERYADFLRTFTITKANIDELGTILNRSITTIGADDVRPTIVTLRNSRTMIVRATPEMMARIAKMIADNDK